MLYPFIQISYHQDKDDNQFYNYYYDFSDDSLFRINTNNEEQIVNRETKVAIPSGMTYIGYLFLVLLSQLFNRYAGNVPAIICMVLIDFLLIIWIYFKLLDHYYAVMTEIKNESEKVSLNREEIIEMMKEPIMIKHYFRMATAVIISLVIVSWSIKRFVFLGTLEFFFLIPIFVWFTCDEVIDYQPANIYRMFKMLKDKKR